MRENYKTANKFYEKNKNFGYEAFKKEAVLPHRYVLVLSNLCNLACSFCFQDRKKNPNRMTKDDWLDFLDKIPQNSRVSLTGGEPLLFKGFKEIFIKASNRNETNIISNGLMLTQEVSELLLSKKNFKVLAISIDDIGDTTRDLTSKQWNQLEKNIHKFLEIRNALEHKAALDIKTVVLDENIEDLFEIHKYMVENLKADTHSLQLLKGAEIQYSDLMYSYDDIHKKYEAHQYKKFDVLINQLEKIRKYSLANYPKAYLHPNIIPLNSSKEILYKDYEYLNNRNHDKEKFSTCLSPWTSVHVNVDGNLFPCMAVPMGNVKTQSLEDIIFSNKFKNFKNEIRKCGTINGCNRCGWLKSDEQSF